MIRPIHALRLSALLAAFAPASLLAQGPDKFDRLIHQWQLSAAIAESSIGSKGPQALRKRGIIAFHRGEYEQAARFFERAKAGISNSSQRAEIDMLLAKSRSGEALFRKRPIHSFPEARISVVFSNEKDEVLTPYLVDAIKKAQPRLRKAIGALPSIPARFELLQSPSDLANLTDLPLDAVYKTGTIGITKYHRVMMASPRVTMRGYDWLDTVVHEYLHFLVSIRTLNRAPVWLQEGLAKFFETSWRSTQPPPLLKHQASLLHDAFTQNKLITLEQMHPSIALLPSQAEAALAYAQVQSMITFLAERRGEGSISTVLAAVASGKEASMAFGEAYRGGWPRFYKDWKKITAKRVAKMQKEAFKPRRFAGKEDSSLQAQDEAPDAFSRLGSGPSRKHARLGSLLQARGHERQALAQFERALRLEPAIAKDPRLAQRLGKLYLNQGRAAQAWQFLERAAKDAPEDAFLATLQAQAALDRKRPDLAMQAAKRALAQNPMIPQLHCILAELYKDPQRIAHERRFCDQDPSDADAPPPDLE